MVPGIINEVVKSNTGKREKPIKCMLKSTLSLWHPGLMSTRVLQETQRNSLSIVPLKDRNHSSLGGDYPQGCFCSIVQSRACGLLSKFPWGQRKASDRKAERHRLLGGKSFLQFVGKLRGDIRIWEGMPKVYKQ